MLQVHAEPTQKKVSSWLQAASTSENTHLHQASTCLPAELPEKHLQAVRHHAALLATGSVQASSFTGADAPLGPDGFKAVTSLCCPAEMETFFGRLLSSMGYISCSKPHIQGLMHWFTCVPDMDFNYLLSVIRNGNPCMYWTLLSTPGGCPALSPQCAGHWCR